MHDAALHRARFLDHVHAPLAAIGEELAHQVGDLRLAGGPAVVDEGLVDRLPHLARGLESAVGFAFEGLHHDGVQRLGQVGDDLGGRRELPVDHGHDGLGVVLAFEEPAAGEHLPERHAEGPDVDAPVDVAPLDLLRRHVGPAPLEGALVGRVEPVGRAGDPEVDDLHGAVVGDEDVVGRDVAMDDLHRLALVPLELVGGVEPLGRLRHDRRGDTPPTIAVDVFLLVEGAGHPARRLPQEELHGDVVRAMVLAEVEDLADVRVVDP